MREKERERRRKRNYNSLLSSPPFFLSPPRHLSKKNYKKKTPGPQRQDLVLPGRRRRRRHPPRGHGRLLQARGREGAVDLDRASPRRRPGPGRVAQRARLRPSGPLRLLLVRGVHALSPGRRPERRDRAQHQGVVRAAGGDERDRLLLPEELPHAGAVHQEPRSGR